MTSQHSHRTSSLPRAALSLLTPAAPDSTPALSDFAELTEFGDDGRPLRWALLRRKQGDVYAFAAGVGGPPWNPDPIPANLTTAAVPIGLDLLRAVRQRKLQAWLQPMAERGRARLHRRQDPAGSIH